MKTAQASPVALPDDVVEYIDRCMKKKHSESYVISVLQKIQTRFGYLPREAMDEVSQRMQIPAVKITGIASFYHFFSLTPKGRHRIVLCMGTACFVKGADKILDTLKDTLGIGAGETTPDGQFSVECARCLGACALAPIMVVDDVVHGNVKVEEVPSILEKYGFKAKKTK